MTSESIFNFIKVNERIGTGGQPTPEQLETASEEGYQAVVNLAPHDAENNALEDEPGIVKALGMTYHHIPVPWMSPEKEQFEDFVAVMRSLVDKKVFVHCAANYRVSAFYSLYAMKFEGWSEQQADQFIARIWESNPEWQMPESWSTFIDNIKANPVTADK